MDPQSSSPLLTVPLEILLQIVHHLTTPEYGNLRLSCKSVEETLLSAFSKEFFTKRQFMFTEFSLQALLDISKSRFSSTLTQVLFGLEQPLKESAANVHTEPTTDAKRNRFIEEYDAFMTLQITGQDVAMLTEAFSNLPILEVVGIRDFYSRSRRRDYPDIEWKSYGLRTFERDTGRTLRPQYFGNFGVDVDAYTSRIFINVLRALGRSTSARPSNFEVILREGLLPDLAFHLPPYLASVVEPVLANIRVFFADIKLEHPRVTVGVVPGS
jgi:hypothetical protein